MVTSITFQYAFVVTMAVLCINTIFLGTTATVVEKKIEFLLKFK